MYIAISIFIAGILIGRIARKQLQAVNISRLILLSIFLLLFLLGAAIGLNDELFSRLPDLGLEALLISLSCILGSIVISRLITPFVRPENNRK